MQSHDELIMKYVLTGACHAMKDSSVILVLKRSPFPGHHLTACGGYKKNICFYISVFKNICFVITTCFHNYNFKNYCHQILST